MCDIIGQVVEEVVGEMISLSIYICISLSFSLSLSLSPFHSLLNIVLAIQPIGKTSGTNDDDLRAQAEELYDVQPRKNKLQWKNTYWQVLPHLEEYERASAQFDHSTAHSCDDVNTSDDNDHASRPNKKMRVLGSGRTRKGATYSKRDQALDKQQKGFKQLLAPLIADSNNDDRLAELTQVIKDSFGSTRLATEIDSSDLERSNIIKTKVDTLNMILNNTDDADLKIQIQTRLKQTALDILNSF